MNARSLCNKLNSFFSFVHYYRPAIVAVTETWLRSDIPGIFVNGYTCFRNDRQSGMGGGTLLLVMNSLSPVQISPQLSNNENFCDSTWCTVRLSNDVSLLVGCIYRSPSSTVENNQLLNSMIEYTCNLPHQYKIIMGDFNYPGVNWDLLSGCSISEAFCDTVNNCFLTQLVRSPTRGPSMLDLVFCNDPSIFYDVEVIEPLLGSDHNSVLCTLKFDTHEQRLKNSTSQVFNFVRADWDLYCEIIGRVEWDDMFLSSCPDRMWNFFKSALLDAARRAIPLKSPCRLYKGVKVHGEVKRALNARRKMYKSFRNCSLSFKNEKLKRADERLFDAVNSARARYELNVVKQLKSSPRFFWKHIRRNLGSRPNIVSVESADGSLTATDVETANEMNNFFASVFVSENNNDFPPLSHVTPFRLERVEVSEYDIHQIIRMLPMNSSAGPDGIPNELFLKAGFILCKILARFFRIIFAKGVLPNEWRLAHVTPIYKKGNRNMCSNYRPISLTSTCCKIAERVVKNNILSFICHHKLIRSTQHGFLPLRSCLSSLLTFLEIVTSNLDKGIDTDAVYIDFAKAFDSVPHGRLLHKLQSFGISGALLRWIESFVTNRRQRVVIRGEMSTWNTVLSGVPQGSVLGPLLFILFIDDIDSCFFHSTILKYADDIKIVSTVNNEVSCTNLQADLDRLVEWSHKWLLNFNFDKCSVLHFGKRNSVIDLYLGDHVLLRASSEIDLGVSLDDSLKVSNQCFKAAMAAQKLLNLVRLTFRYLDVESLSVIYKAMIRPRLEYCIPVWTPYYQKDINLLEKIQRRVTRMIPHLKVLPYRDRLRHFKLTSLATRRLRFDLMTVFKMVHGLIDVPFDCFFALDDLSITRGHCYKLKVSYARLSCRRFFFTQRVVRWWNKLPRQCVSAASINSFKTHLDIFLESCDLW